jgi:hypothetical protein
MGNLIKKVIKEEFGEDWNNWQTQDVHPHDIRRKRKMNHKTQDELETLRYENVQKGDILVIHPDDRSTDFLKPSYEGLNATVITQRNQLYNLKETVKNHNRIIMMGHGAPSGLFMPQMSGVEENEHGELVEYNTYSFGGAFANILKEKRIAAIWCNADGYVVPNDLHGFYTGMAISELCEADYCGVRGCNMRELNESSTKFALALKEALKVDGPESVNIFKEMYHNPDNPIMVYNRQRIYFR